MKRATAIRDRGKEFGSVTGRPRRCGWFDVPLLKYSAMINGFDSLIMTKLDVLDGLKRIPVCIEYRGVTGMPCSTSALEAIEPVYEYLPGWDHSTEGISRFEDLPPAAKDYIAFLERWTQVEIGCISTGPERNQTISRPGTRFMELAVPAR